MPRRKSMVNLNDLSPLAFWEGFAQFVTTKEDGDFESVAWMCNENQEGLGGALHGPALRFIESLFEILLIEGRYHWGEPDYLFKRSARDRIAPAKAIPAWFPDYRLYPQGVPVLLYRIIGWDRKRKRGRSVIGFAYCSMYSDEGSEEGSWDIGLDFGVLSNSR